MKLIERRLTPADSPLAITTAMVLAVAGGDARYFAALCSLWSEPVPGIRRPLPRTIRNHARLRLYPGAYRAVNVDCPGHCRQLAIRLWLPGLRRMLRDWRRGHQLVGSGNGAGRGLGPAALCRVPAFGDLAEFLCRGRVGGRGRFHPSAVWGATKNCSSP